MNIWLVFFFKENPTNFNPGVFIDIDGVVLHGGKPFDFSKEAIHVSYLSLKTTSLKLANYEKKAREISSHSSRRIKCDS